MESETHGNLISGLDTNSFRWADKIDEQVQNSALSGRTKTWEIVVISVYEDKKRHAEYAVDIDLNGVLRVFILWTLVFGSMCFTQLRY
jgi:hypothetical protein